MKAIAYKLLAARSRLLNAQDDERRAFGAFIIAEREYIQAMGEVRTLVCDSTMIRVASAFPDGKDGEHLEFDTVEVLS